MTQIVAPKEELLTANVRTSMLTKERIQLEVAIDTRDALIRIADRLEAITRYGYGDLPGVLKILQINR